MALLVVLMLARQTLAIFPTLEEVKRQLKDIDKVVDQGAPGSAKDGAAGRARTSLGPSSLHGMTSVHNFPVETATQGFYMLNADIMFLDRMWNDFTFIKKLMELTMFSRTSTYNKIKKAFYQYCYSLMEKTLWKTYENMAKSIGFEINREIRSLYD